ncbi:MAG: endo alpha-1,4 polygalactosaminidase [Chloroflexi bacterium]|nr:MAG: endo alpha-1,4 polygalactosaminidase [Chloroflexota bacterium]
MPTARTNAAGAFQATFVVPANARSGRHTVKATAGRRSASATFTVSTAPLPTATRTPPAVSYWKPALNTSWQIQYTGVIDTSLNVAMYNLDGFDTSAATVAALHSAGKRVVCYISAGSWEDWRPDAGQFPAAVKGNELDGWPGERWLDIRRLDILGPIMEARMDMCQAKGFDAVDPDNVNGYTNPTGFPLSASDQLRYNRWLADAAHARGLAIGLKNDGDQATQLLAWFDFATVEQCYQFNECAVWDAFVAAGKPVFVIEYSGVTTSFCPQANAANFNALKKRLELDAWRQACR